MRYAESVSDYSSRLPNRGANPFRYKGVIGREAKVGVVCLPIVVEYLTPVAFERAHSCGVQTNKRDWLRWEDPLPHTTISMFGRLQDFMQKYLGVQKTYNLLLHLIVSQILAPPSVPISPVIIHVLVQRSKDPFLEER